MVRMLNCMWASRSSEQQKEWRFQVAYHIYWHVHVASGEVTVLPSAGQVVAQVMHKWLPSHRWLHSMLGWGYVPGPLASDRELGSVWLSVNPAFPPSSDVCRCVLCLVVDVLNFYLWTPSVEGWSPKGRRGKESNSPVKQQVKFQPETFGPYISALATHSQLTLSCVLCAVCSSMKLCSYTRGQTCYVVMAI